MAVLGFHSWSEFVVYLTFLFFGVSIMMVSNAITAAPSFITEFYKYAQGDKNAKAEDPSFWINVLTYYNAAVFGMQVVCETFMLTPLGRSIPLRPRLICGLIMPFGEMLALILVALGTRRRLVPRPPLWSLLLSVGSRRRSATPVRVPSQAHSRQSSTAR
ncbi:nucleoside transporter 1 [Trypanosoma conorhini]|uniref:Nucleoside transporter 1 n=1 Tax=Trypanosoma conorhini TaxID=83891 RepID=A0A422NGG9_9TRYP|nr:nucleoside transporter 1 [Trypanosoma conorhini]RNF04560.1 nucleoside transporter 1 [Trypanosoma conorhini]